MKLAVSESKRLGEIQQMFERKYPFLKLELYRILDAEIQVKKTLSPETVLKNVAAQRDGFDIEDKMSVQELSQLFMKHFGLRAIVFRKAGIIWLETTLTAEWSLRKQNDQGKEITNPVRKKSEDQS